MNLERYIVISGAPGVYRLISARHNGVLVEDFKEKRNRFIATRQNQVMPLATISIYADTEEGSVPLADVFDRMLKAYPQTPPPASDASSNALREYFTHVLPEHDRYRVHIADIKKCIRWFNFMREYGIFEQLREAERAEETAATEATSNEKMLEQADSSTTEETAA
ncbi:MAG: DUF5606 domain-containing protein [Saprospiraceae bacterium]|nr:DUF5606 domain-containing protein [Saprospiraceae bacterium]MDW8484445.1 DUF5606 domain-containing protein [Saprospiraceae bacterium]